MLLVVLLIATCRSSKAEEERVIVQPTINMVSHGFTCVLTLEHAKQNKCGNASRLFHLPTDSLELFELQVTCEQNFVDALAIPQQIIVVISTKEGHIARPVRINEDNSKVSESLPFHDANNHLENSSFSSSADWSTLVASGFDEQSKRSAGEIRRRFEHTHEELPFYALYRQLGQNRYEIEFNSYCDVEDCSSVSLTTFDFTQTAIDTFNRSTQVRRFFVETLNVGKVVFEVSLLLRGYAEERTADRVLQEHVIGSVTVSFHVSRARTGLDLAFEYIVLLLSIMSAMHTGCQLGMGNLWGYLKYQRTLLMISAGSQIAILPCLVFGASVVFSLSFDVSLGYLVTLCLPGFAISILVCIVLNGEVQLACVFMFYNSLLASGLSPFWIYVMGNFLPFKVDGDIISYERDDLFFLAIMVSSANLLTALMIILGSIIRRLSEKVAEFLDVAVFQPFFLLSFILFITIGCQVNAYVFMHSETSVMFAAVMFVMFGYSFCYVSGMLACLDSSHTKALASVGCTFNCLLATFVMRFSMPSVQGDLCVIPAFWLQMWMLLPSLLYWLMRHVRSAVHAFIKSRREKQYRTTGLLDQVANLTKGMAMITVPFYQQAIKSKAAVLNGGNAKVRTGDIAKMIRQKVTTL